MEKDFFFLEDQETKRNTLSDEREQYNDWRNDNQFNNKPFFAIHSDFEPLFLKDISGGALKLYLYLGFRAKYRTGELWESIPSIALFFEKDERTISKWFSELVDLGIVSRYQVGYKRSANTFLKPYGFQLEIINMLGMSSAKHVEEYININEISNIRKAILMNYEFVEYTMVLEEQVTRNLKKLHCFLNFDRSNVHALGNFLKEKKVSLDNFDIRYSIYNSKNEYNLLYKEILEYYKEEVL